MPPELVTPAMRSDAKAVNFGILYGMGAFSLSQDIHVSVRQANQYIQNYMAQFPSVGAFMEKTVENAKLNGYVTTYFKRRRPVLANVMGGYSGPGVFPVAVRMVYQVTGAVSIPVIGMGGVSSAQDVIEMMMAGAKAVQVGAANLVDPYACKKIIDDLPREMERLGIESLSDIQRV